jgi:excisionase family DNA binding protein
MKKKLPAPVDDMLTGAKEIAEFLGITVRQVFHAAATKSLPVIRLGRRILARKSTLWGWVEEQETAAAPALKAVA